MKGTHPAQGSLRVRMLLSASLVLILFLGIMGLVLDNAYRVSAEQSVSERLVLHIYSFISASDEDLLNDAASIYLPEVLQEPQFNTLGSGLFGLVFDARGNEIWRSRSALGLELTDAEKSLLLAPVEPGVVNFNQLLRDEPLFYMTYRVIWQSTAGEAQYVYAVLEDLGPYSNEVRAFRNNLWTWLVAGVLVLVGLQAAIMYWGLLPIAGLERDLKAIEGGSQAYLEGSYPSEIAGVTQSLNMLLASEREQRERYRTTLADLAHSLKTPLAILQAEAGRPSSSAEVVTEQVSRMNEIVSYQLERAVASSSSLVKVSVDVRPVAEKLVNALTRVYQDRSVTIQPVVADVAFPGDERDLMEMLGNLLDNACKYGAGEVRLTIRNDDGLQMCVEDNGPGIEDAARRLVLERGARLDTRESGQGIGLAVVAEIVDRYNGEISIGQSDLGGASITLSFRA